jgi:rod shape-determining protein MreD
VPSPSNPQPVLHKPASGRFLAISLALALLLNFLPWDGSIMLVWPDFVALVLIYWTIHQPRRVGLTTAWSLGLLMDIADGVLFGQHALAYTVVAYAALFLHRRIQMFNPWQQALYVFGLLFLMFTIMLFVRLAAGAPFPGMLYFASSIIGAVFWPLLSSLLQTAQRRKPTPESSYPSGAR